MDKALKKKRHDQAVKFFEEWAGVSYDPKKETPAQGKRRGALALARAESIAQRKGWFCEWRIDDLDSRHWNDEKPYYAQYLCVLHDKRGNVINSCGGIDFGREGSPIGDPYARVMEAELVLDVLEGKP